jgi:chitinase
MTSHRTPHRTRPAPRRRPARLLAALTATALAAVVGLVGIAGPAHAASTLGATYQTLDYGYTMGTYVITNTGDTPTDTWRLEFDLPSGTTVGQVWYGVKSGTDSHVIIDAEYYNKAIAAGGSTGAYSPMFVVTGSGAPTNCRINGVKCDGSPDAPPSAPAGVHVTGTTTKSVSLAWTAAQAGDWPVTGYGVTVTTAAGPVTADVAVDGTTAVVSGLDPKTAYAFTVTARDGHGNVSPASDPASATTADPADDTTPPTTPGNLRVTSTDSVSVGLAWSASTDAHGIAGYDVYQGSALVKSVTGTSTTVTGLSPMTAYTFTVKARDTYDNVSAASAAVQATTSDVVGTGAYARVGYFVQWGIYGRQFFVKNLETSGAASKLTHINYAFTNIDPTNLTCMEGVTQGTRSDPEDPSQGDGAGDADADYGRPMTAAQSVDGVGDTGWEPLRGNFNQLKKLKALHPDLKVLMSVGGWTYSKYFHDAALTDASRKKFVSSCIDLYIKGNLPAAEGAGGDGVAAGIFDGIDVDWEWPGAEGHPGNHLAAEDKHNLTLLLAEFRKELDAYSATSGERYLLTAFTPADPTKIDAGWEISGSPNVFDYLDFANVQGYDFHGSGSDNSWEPNRTGDQANWYVDDGDPYTTHFSAQDALDVYLDAGVSPRRLTIGVPFYGRGWQGVADGGATGEWQTASGAAPGQFADEAGTRGYANLKATFPSMTVVHDAQSISTFGYTGPGGQWWTFDDAWSLGQKMALVKQEGLLGTMIWELSGDDGILLPAIDAGLS